MADRGDTHYHVRKLNLWFTLSSLLLLVSAVWMVLDDWARGWKHYQREFRQIEIARASDPTAEAVWGRVAVEGFAVPDGTGAAEEELPRAALEQVMADFSRAPGLERYVALVDGHPAGAASCRFDRGIAQLLRRCQPVVGHAILLPFAEAYSVVAEQLARAKPGDTVDEKALLDAALVEGRQAWLLRRISSEAAIGKLLFANGLSLMRHMGLADEATPRSLAARRALLVELRGLANVMETMRLSTVALADRLPGSGG